MPVPISDGLSCVQVSGQYRPKTSPNEIRKSSATITLIQATSSTFCHRKNGPHARLTIKIVNTRADQFCISGGGYVSPSLVNSALDCLAARANCGSFVPSTAYPAIRGAMTWSINWDASNGYNFANTVAPHLASLP